MKYETKCPNCFNDLTQAESIEVHFSADGQEFDRYSSVSKDGVLSDPTEEGLLALGLHAGTRCQSCDEELDEMEPAVEGKMKWYVKTKQGGVRGPMSWFDAEGESHELDGSRMFSERIFSPQFVTTQEVEELLKELRVLSTRTGDCRDCGGFDSEDRDLCQNAIDTITLLSREKPDLSISCPCPQKTKEIILQLLSSDYMSESKRKEVVVLLTQLSIPRVVTGSIEGGVLSLDKVPAGVEVEINDYDVSGDEENLEEDEGGSFSPCRWGS